MKDREAVIGRGMYVDLDDVRPCVEGRPHGGQGVFEVGVRGRQHPFSRARVALELLAREELMHASVRDETGVSGWRRDAPGRIEDVNKGREDRGDQQDPAYQGKSPEARGSFGGIDGRMMAGSAGELQWTQRHVALELTNQGRLLGGGRDAAVDHECADYEGRRAVLEPSDGECGPVGVRALADEA